MPGSGVKNLDIAPCAVLDNGYSRNMNVTQSTQTVAEQGEIVRIIRGEWAGHFGEVIAIDDSEWSCYCVDPEATQVRVYLSPEEITPASSYTYANRN
jgi:transcription antitermination factor NusG